MASRMPTSIRIGPWVVAIRRPTEVIGEDDKILDGSYTYEERSIDIDRSLVNGASAEILMHEVLHAIWHQTGLTFGPKAMERYEERIIRTLAPALVDVLQRNPNFVRFIVCPQGGQRGKQ